MCNYWLIPMNFETCDFKHLLDEYEQGEEKILWQAPPQKVSSKISEGTEPQSGIAHDIKVGDCVYFYVTKLPSENRENLSRILLRGFVKETPSAMKKKLVWPDASDKEIIYAFSIENLTTLKENELKNDGFLRLISKKDKTSDKRKYYLRADKDYEFIYPQGWTNWPDKDNNKNFKIELIEELNRSFEESDSFNALINHFRKTCYFCNKLFYGNSWEECEHKTFVGRNGLNYYEYHHFVLQKIAKKHPSLKSIIDSSANGLCLCSNCHNRIHYGTLKDIEEMISVVLKDENVLDNDSKKKIRDAIGDENILKWLLEEYTSNQRDS